MATERQILERRIKALEVTVKIFRKFLKEAYGSITELSPELFQALDIPLKSSWDFVIVCEKEIEKERRVLRNHLSAIGG